MRGLALLLLLGCARAHPSHEELEELKGVLHKLTPAEAKRRIDALRAKSAGDPPPTRQGKIDHFVVVFMENHAFDHMLGCMTRDGLDGIPPEGHLIPRDPDDKTAGFVNVTCGTSPYVCSVGAGYDTFAGKMAPDADPSFYPYGAQDDKCVGRGGGAWAAEEPEEEENVASFPSSARRWTEIESPPTVPRRVRSVYRSRPPPGTRSRTARTTARPCRCSRASSCRSRAGSPTSACMRLPRGGDAGAGEASVIPRGGGCGGGQPAANGSRFPIVRRRLAALLRRARGLIRSPIPPPPPPDRHRRGTPPPSLASPVAEECMRSPISIASPNNNNNKTVTYVYIFINVHIGRFGLFNKMYTAVPSASTPNHLFAQSATSCGIHDNIMYSDCGGATDTFPMFTVYDNLYLHNVSFKVQWNGMECMSTKSSTSTTSRSRLRVARVARRIFVCARRRARAEYRHTRHQRTGDINDSERRARVVAFDERTRERRGRACRVPRRCCGARPPCFPSSPPP